MKKLFATICLGTLAATVAPPATAQNSAPATPIEVLFGGLLSSPSSLRRAPRAYYRPARLATPQRRLDWGFSQKPAARPQNRVRHAAAVPPVAVSRTAVTAKKTGLDPRYARQVVSYQTKYKAGTIVVDTDAKFLYLVQDDGKAMRYGVGVGRPGFEWSGTTTIKRKVEWPAGGDA